MGEGEGHGSQTLGGRVDEHHGVLLPQLAGLLVPHTAPQVDHFLAVVIGAAGAAQFTPPSEVLDKCLAHGLKATTDLPLDFRESRTPTASGPGAGSGMIVPLGSGGGVCECHAACGCIDCAFGTSANLGQKSKNDRRAASARLRGRRKFRTPPVFFRVTATKISSRHWNARPSRLTMSAGFLRVIKTTRCLCQSPRQSVRLARHEQEYPVSGRNTVPAVVFDKVSFAFDEQVILRDISFSVAKGSMAVLLGASGAGKSVVLKLILGLLRPDAGAILVNGERIDRMTERDLLRMRGDIGMLFQENALFDSLTVAENVGYRLYEETDMPEDQVRSRIQEVLGFIGLGEYIDRMPSELSGGQRRRVAIARAMAAEPALVLLDDPTTGLDPITAATVDDEIVKLRDLGHVTSIAVTHQIRDAFYVATHEAVGTHARAQIRRQRGEGRTGALHGALRRPDLL